MISDNYKCDGQMNIFDFLDPVREPCGRRCSVEWCSKKCFEKRGQIWDYKNSCWMKNDKGEILKVKNKECDWEPDSPRKEPHHCDGCLWKYNGKQREFCEIVDLYEDIFKCDMKITEEEGWKRIYKVGGRYTGDYPEGNKWQKIEIWSYIEEFDKYVHGFGEGKDRTIKRNTGGDIGEVTAWRYV